MAKNIEEREDLLISSCNLEERIHDRTLITKSANSNGREKYKTARRRKELRVDLNEYKSLTLR